MRKALFAVGAALFVAVQPCHSKFVCEEGFNKYGEWAPCLRGHYEPGHEEVELPVDESRVGQVEKIRKNLDGSVTVWRHGSSDTEEWTQTDDDTWERKR